ncbi:hypothetical protein KQ41_12790 [Lysinibacillus fusiformis]|uniref:hypothetical protein n=1 Tax=Lysinibacillus fusiformis TaxID=28031 RepID=UPI0005011347|nr:hypothetical protein [Lysinibacillus fusiformis]KGA82066.1 hypothetical protein KQ41_12790 [Lysinibacillus fusiformis]
MNNSKDNPLSGILSKRTNLGEILLVAFIIAFGTNIVVSSLVSFSFFDSKIFIWVGLLIVIFAFIYLSMRMLSHREFNKKIKASIIYDVKNKRVVGVNNYNYSNDIFKYFNSAFNESRDIKAIWEISYLDNVNSNQNKTKSMQLIEEVTEYILLDTVSRHLNSYFNSEDIAKNNTTIINRNEISEVITKNRFLELFSKPMNERFAFINEGVTLDEEKHIERSSKGNFYKNFELELPENSKLVREKDGSITIKNKRFMLNFKVDFKGVNSSSIPYEYLKIFHKLNITDYKQFQIDINTKIKFNYSTFISNKGWEYYNWLDSLIKRIEDNFCPIKFREEINWTSNQLILKYLENEMVNTRNFGGEVSTKAIANKETFIFYANSNHGMYSNIWSNLNSGTYFNKFLSTDISKIAIEKLMSQKQKGNLSNLDVLGVYFKDDGSKSVFKIKIEDFIYDDEKVDFKFVNLKELSIKSTDLLNTIDKEYNYYYEGSQLIVCIDEDIQKLLSKVKPHLVVSQ